MRNKAVIDAKNWTSFKVVTELMSEPAALCLKCFYEQGKW